MPGTNRLSSPGKPGYKTSLSDGRNLHWEEELWQADLRAELTVLVVPRFMAGGSSGGVDCTGGAEIHIFSSMLRYKQVVVLG